MNLYKEEDFYKDKGWPAEEYLYCNFTIPVDSVSEYGSDYNQFLLVVNSLNPYRTGSCGSGRKWQSLSQAENGYPDDLLRAGHLRHKWPSPSATYPYSQVYPTLNEGNPPYDAEWHPRSSRVSVHFSALPVE